MANSEKIKNFFNRRGIKITILAVVVLAAVATIGYFLFGQNKIDLGNNLSKKTQIQKVSRLIDGVLVEKGKENPYPVAVMIENLSTIRPQSGLNKANVVYEALAEGGITRFLAIFANTDAIEEIGPVRSARDYFLDWVSEYHALFAHCGGSPSALSLIKQYNLFNLDQISGDHPYYWRDKTRATATEHTLFTSSELLARALRDKKLPKEGDFKPWLFKEETTLSDRPDEAKKITIDYSTFSYKVEYTYDRKSNVYLRSDGGAPHLDFKTQEQLSAKNVVVQYVKTNLTNSSERLAMETIGDGGALVFQDGKMISGTWKKEAREERTIFYDENGNEVKFNSGSIWIEVVPADRQVKYE